MRWAMAGGLALAAGMLDAATMAGEFYSDCEAAVACECPVVWDSCCDAPTFSPAECDATPAPLAAGSDRRDDAKSLPAPKPAPKTPTPAPRKPQGPATAAAKPAIKSPPPMITPTPASPQVREALPPLAESPQASPAPAIEPTPAPMEPTPAAPGSPTDSGVGGTYPEPTAPVLDRYGFPPTAPADAAPAASAPAIESEPSAPAENDAAPAPSPAPVEEAEPADEKPQGESSTPDLEELFNDATPRGPLVEPGGWESETNRTWRDASGRTVAAARLAGVTGERVELIDEDGGKPSLAYRELSDADLTFVRRQVEARRVQLAQRAGTVKMLATQAP